MLKVAIEANPAEYEAGAYPLRLTIKETEPKEGQGLFFIGKTGDPDASSGALVHPTEHAFRDGGCRVSEDFHRQHMEVSAPGIDALRGGLRALCEGAEAHNESIDPPMAVVLRDASKIVSSQVQVSA